LAYTFQWQGQVRQQEWILKMDEAVRKASAKWPDVPHCYGWLALDARGNWRMRDEQVQASNQPGDRITNAALLGFINRNYSHDEKGRWYFQNGPQRVYVNLEATPYIARTDPAQGFILHTGEPISIISGAWMTETGRLVLQADGRVALVDDRDLAQCLADLRIDGKAVSDERLIEWLSRPKDVGPLSLLQVSRKVPVQHMQKTRWPGVSVLFKCRNPMAPEAALFSLAAVLDFIATARLKFALTGIDHRLIIKRRIRRAARNRQLIQSGLQISR
jgi:hypothetical protein